MMESSPLQVQIPSQTIPIKISDSVLKEIAVLLQFYFLSLIPLKD